MNVKGLLYLIIGFLLAGCTRYDADLQDYNEKIALTVIVRGGNLQPHSQVFYGKALLGPHQGFLEPISDASFVLSDIEGTKDSAIYQSEGNYIFYEPLDSFNISEDLNFTAWHQDLGLLNSMVSIPETPKFNLMSTTRVDSGFFGDSLLVYHHHFKVVNLGEPNTFQWQFSYDLQIDERAVYEMDRINAWVEIDGYKSQRKEAALFSVPLKRNESIDCHVYMRKPYYVIVDTYSEQLFDLLIKTQYPLNEAQGAFFDPDETTSSDFEGAIGYLGWIMSDTIF